MPGKSVSVPCPEGFLRKESPIVERLDSFLTEDVLGRTRQPFVTLRFIDADGNKWQKVCSVQGSVVDTIQSAT